MKPILVKLLNDLFIVSLAAFFIFSLIEWRQPGMIGSVLNPNILILIAIAAFILKNLLKSTAPDKN